LIGDKTNIEIHDWIAHKENQITEATQIQLEENPYPTKAVYENLHMSEKEVSWQASKC
jgi:hypothetical protein